jgi:hypothetical protein
MNESSADKKTLSKLTTSDDDRVSQFLTQKEQLFKKIVGSDIEGLRMMGIEKLDLNVFEPFEDLSFIDESITPLIFCAYYGMTYVTKERPKSRGFC